MKNTLKIFGLLALSLGFIQCEKEKEEVPSTAPGINIIAPVVGTEYNHMDQMAIAIDFTDGEQLHNYSVELYNESADSLFYKSSGHQHTTLLSFQDTVMLMAHDHTDMKLVATVTNHLDEETKDSVMFHVHPAGGHGIIK